MFKVFKAGIIATMFAFGSASAAPVLIDFERGPTGHLTGYEYASQGVVFESIGGSGVQEYNFGGVLTESVTSNNWYRPLRISFVNPTDSNQSWTVSSFSLLNRFDEDHWNVTAYDLNNVALGSQVLNHAVGTINFSGIGAIHSVVLDAQQTAFAADNLQFDGLAAPVPEPETYAMLVFGLGLLGWKARRKQNRVA